MKLRGNDVLMQTKGKKQWRLVDRIGSGHVGKPKNTLARELALSF